MKRQGCFPLAVLALALIPVPGCDQSDNVTAPTLSATCSATPSEGDAPLEVAFALNVAGAEGPLRFSVAYGDGATSTDPDATHVYEQEGLYTAAFTVTTDTQSARCSTPVTVSAGSSAGEGPADGDENLPPTVTFKTTPRARGGQITGTAPLSVRFNVCLTADPDGDGLYFTMDLDGDGNPDKRGSTGASCRGDWTYAVGTWKAEVCVTDILPDGKRLHEFQCERYIVVAS